MRRFRVQIDVKLVGARKKKRNQCLLVIGDDGKNIEANTLGQNGFIQKPVALHLRQRLRDAFDGYGFEFELHGYSYAFALLKTRNNFETGSKKRSTTRSLSGMI